MNNEKFIVGEIYLRPGLFGPSWQVRCTDRTETTVTFAQVGYEEEENGTKIEVGSDHGVEACLCWEYSGSKAYIFSDTKF